MLILFFIIFYALILIILKNLSYIFCDIKYYHSESANKIATNILICRKQKKGESAMSSQSFRFSPEHPTAQNITLLNTSSSRYEGDWPSIPHSHAFTELFYVRDGQGDFLIEDQIFPISKDDLVIINPHINHTEISKGSPPLSYFTVGVDGLCFSFNGHKEYRIFNCREKKTDLLFYFNSLFQELDRQSEGYETICSHMLDILILQLRRITDSPLN